MTVRCICCKARLTDTTMTLCSVCRGKKLRRCNNCGKVQVARTCEKSPVDGIKEYCGYARVIRDE